MNLEEIFLQQYGIWIKIDNFEEPVCNIFQDTILNDQLCYEVDVSRFVNKDNIKQLGMCTFVCVCYLCMSDYEILGVCWIFLKTRKLGLCNRACD